MSCPWHSNQILKNVNKNNDWDETKFNEDGVSRDEEEHGSAEELEIFLMFLSHRISFIFVNEPRACFLKAISYVIWCDWLILSCNNFS